LEQASRTTAVEGGPVVVWKLMVAVDHPVHEREGEERKREDREEKERVVLFNLPTSRANRFSVTKSHHLL
jgi:hypothetical protein